MTVSLRVSQGRRLGVRRLPVRPGPADKFLTDPVWGYWKGVRDERARWEAS